MKDHIRVQVKVPVSAVIKAVIKIEGIFNRKINSNNNMKNIINNSNISKSNNLVQGIIRNSLGESIIQVIRKKRNRLLEVLEGVIIQKAYLYIYLLLFL